MSNFNATLQRKNRKEKYKKQRIEAKQQHKQYMPQYRTGLVKT